LSKDIESVYTDSFSITHSPQRTRIRNIAYTAVFGSLWGFSEFFLGSIFHALQIPFRSLILQSIGVLIAFTGAIFITRNFAILRIGIIAAFFKMFSFGGGNTLPVIMAILVQSAIADLVLLVARKNRVGYPLAAGVSMMWIPFNMPLFYFILLFLPFLKQVILGETSISEFDGIMIDFLTRLKLSIESFISKFGFNFDIKTVFIYGVAIYTGFLFIFGGLMGAFSWYLGKKIKEAMKLE